MKLDRAYYLRHKRGFSDSDFDKIRNGWLEWVEDIRQKCDAYEPSSPKGISPEYLFYEPILSKDRQLVTITFDGRNLFFMRGGVPSMLYRGLDRDVLEETRLGTLNPFKNRWRKVYWEPALSKSLDSDSEIVWWEMTKGFMGAVGLVAAKGRWVVSVAAVVLMTFVVRDGSEAVESWQDIVIPFITLVGAIVGWYTQIRYGPKRQPRFEGELHEFRG